MQFKFGLSTLFLLVVAVSVSCWLATQELLVTESDTKLKMRPGGGGIAEITTQQVTRKRVNPDVLLVGLGFLLTLLWVMADARQHRNPATAKPPSKPALDTLEES